MKDYYEILGTSFTSTNIEIKKVYRKKAIRWHPDKNQGDKECEEKFKEILEAYNVLINEESRKEYDIKYSQFKIKFDYLTQKDEENKIKSKTKKQHKPLFTEEERNNQDTPEIYPEFDYIFGKLPENIDFFMFPKRCIKK